MDYNVHKLEKRKIFRNIGEKSTFEMSHMPQGRVHTLFSRRKAESEGLEYGNRGLAA